MNFFAVCEFQILKKIWMNSTIFERTLAMISSSKIISNSIDESFFFQDCWNFYVKNIADIINNSQK